MGLPEIPSPSQVMARQWTSVAGLALALKQSLIIGLKQRQTSFKGTYSDQVLNLLRPEFRDAGWEIVDGGTSIHLVPLKGAPDQRKALPPAEKQEKKEDAQ